MWGSKSLSEDTPATLITNVRQELGLGHSSKHKETLYLCDDDVMVGEAVEQEGAEIRDKVFLQKGRGRSRNLEMEF